MSERLLDIAGLNVRFGDEAVVSDLFLSVSGGEAVGIVGEGGSGKSAAMLATLRLHAPGAVIKAERHLMAGQDVRDAPERVMRDLRGRFAAMIFRDPLAALNPLMTAGEQIAEVLERHRGLTRRAARAGSIEWLGSVGIADAASRARCYPHALSAGLRHRVMIAVALAGDPALLIADEPIAALDVTMQADLTRLIAHLRRERSMGLIWVTRDLASMAGIVDRVVVVYAGRIMEMASVNRLYESPRHPYTQALFASLPRLDRRRGTAVAGVPPRPGRAPSGCPFAPRCAYSTSHCAELPPLFEIGDSLVACWHAS